MAISDEFIQELKFRSDIESVVSSYVNLKRRGSTLVGLCPFHNEKTPSFTVYPNNGSCYCFGCGAGGDVISFIRKIENLDYIEAVRFLAERAGMQMPEDGYDDSMQRLRMRVLEINRAAARFFHGQLLASAGRPGLDYLLGRQLSMATIKHFGLGFAPDSWDALLHHLRGAGFHDEEIVQSDLVVRHKSRDGYFDRFRNRVMFPIIDLRGNVIAFGGRILPGSDDRAKYVNSADTPVFKKSRNVYALNFAKNSKRSGLILAEGYMDVIALHQAGFDNAVAALGTAFTAEQAKLLSRYTQEVSVTLDADAAGEKATNRAIEILSGAGVSVKVVRIQGGKDPDEFIKAYGPERFQALLEGAGNDIEYKLASARARYDTQTDDGRLSFLREAASILARVDDEIARDLYAGRVSEQNGIAKDALMREIKLLARRRRAGENKKAIREVVRRPVARDPLNPERSRWPRAAAAEETLISLLMLNPGLYPVVEQRLRPEDFLTSFNARVYAHLCGLYDTGQSMDLTRFSAAFSPDEMGRIVEIQNRKTSRENARTELEDCIGVILEEKEKMEAADPAQLSGDEWAGQLRKLAEKKKGS